MAWVVEVEDLLGKAEEAAAGLPELDQRQRVELKQRDVLGQLELSDVAVEVGDIEPLEVKGKLVAGEKSFLERIPVAEADE